MDAQIDVDPLTAVNTVGEPHTINATVQQDDGLLANAPGGDAVTGFGPAPNGTCVVFTLNDNTAGADFTTPNDGNDCGGVAGNLDDCLTTGGTCSATITTTTPGSVDIRATTTFSVAGESITRTTGTGGLNSADANKRYVDAQIDVDPLTAVNTVGEPHTINATVQQDDGLLANAPGGDAVTGFGPAPNGTCVVFTLNDNTAGADFTDPERRQRLRRRRPATSTTASPPAAPARPRSRPPRRASVDIHATTTFSVAGESMTRTTGSGGYNSADANKRYVDAQIDVDPLTAVNTVGEPHTINATVQQDDGLLANAPGGDAVTGFGPAPNGTCVVFTLNDNTAGAGFTDPERRQRLRRRRPATSTTASPPAAPARPRSRPPRRAAVDIHATTTFSVAGESMTRTTGSGGHNSADANKRYVDAQIDVDPLTAVNTVGEPHTINATVQQDDGLLVGAPGGDAVTGFGPAPNGTCVVFTLNDNTAGADFTDPERRHQLRRDGRQPRRLPHHRRHLLGHDHDHARRARSTSTRPRPSRSPGRA